MRDDLSLLLRQRIVSQLEEDGQSPDLVQAVAGPAVADQRLLQIRWMCRTGSNVSKLRDDGRLAALQAVVQRASRLAEKGDLGNDQLIS